MRNMISFTVILVAFVLMFFPSALHSQSDSVHLAVLLGRDGSYSMGPFYRSVNEDELSIVGHLRQSDLIGITTYLENPGGFDILQPMVLENPGSAILAADAIQKAPLPRSLANALHRSVLDYFSAWAARQPNRAVLFILQTDTEVVRLRSQSIDIEIQNLPATLPDHLRGFPILFAVYRRTGTDYLLHQSYSNDIQSVASMNDAVTLTRKDYAKLLQSSSQTESTPDESGLSPLFWGVLILVVLAFTFLFVAIWRMKRRVALAETQKALPKTMAKERRQEDLTLEVVRTSMNGTRTDPIETTLPLHGVARIGGSRECDCHVELPGDKTVSVQYFSPSDLEISIDRFESIGDIVHVKDRQELPYLLRQNQRKQRIPINLLPFSVIFRDGTKLHIRKLQNAMPMSGSVGQPTSTEMSVIEGGQNVQSR